MISSAFHRHFRSPRFVTRPSRERRPLRAALLGMAAALIFGGVATIATLLPDFVSAEAPLVQTLTPATGMAGSSD